MRKASTSGTTITKGRSSEKDVRGPVESETVVEPPFIKSQDNMLKEEPWYKNTKIWINLAGYVTVTITFVVIKVRPDLMPEPDRSFQCGDPGLNLPIREESVHQRTLYISTCSIMLMSIFISEGVSCVSPEYQVPKEDGSEPTTKEKILLFVNLVISKLLYGYLGLMLTLNLTIQTQHLSSVHRPDFLSTCKLREGSCVTPYRIADMGACENSNADRMRDARMSFPSDFAAVAFYMTMFSSLIIERAISTDYFALKVAIQSSFISWSIYLSCARIKDHKNSPADTIAGVTLGLIMAFFMDYLSTYMEYQDMPYDPANITLNVQDWEDFEQPLEDDAGAHFE